MKKDGQKTKRQTDKKEKKRRRQKKKVKKKKTNENDLERVQKSALKLILKDEYRDYKNALKVLAVESLFERRERLPIK